MSAGDKVPTSHDDTASVQSRSASTTNPASSPAATDSDARVSSPSGVSVWHDCVDATVDICFVHGLNGHRDGTWTVEGEPVPWPVSLLPSRLSQARLLTYGYDAAVIRSSVASRNHLLDHAINLVVDLTNNRPDHLTSRPLFFVAHSIGGIVCKEAIIQSRDSPEPHLRGIFNYFSGIIFMGTPHRGPWMTLWKKTPASVLGFVEPNNYSLFDILGMDNKLLQSTQDRFWSMMCRCREESRQVNVTCFYEQLPVGMGHLVLPRESATLENFESCSIYANHNDMVKFRSPEDVGFRRLSAALIRWKQSITGLYKSQEPRAVTRSTDIQKWLMGVYIPNDIYDNAVQKRMAGSCEWILRRETFLSWASHDFPTGLSRFLWVKGPIGFGKTTLCARIIEYLYSTLDPPPAHFFFPSDPEGHGDPFVAVRSWLTQLLSHPATFKLIWEEFDARSDQVATRANAIRIFRKVVHAIPGLTFVVDGLDECLGLGPACDTGDSISVTEFLETIQQAVAGTSTRILIVSRDVPYIRRPIAREVSGIFLFHYEISLRDIQSDINSYSRSIVEKRLHCTDEVMKHDLSLSLAQRCNGQFLRVKIQGKALRDGQNRKQLEAAIDKPPAMINNFYDRAWKWLSDLPESRTHSRLLRQEASANVDDQSDVSDVSSVTSVFTKDAGSTRGSHVSNQSQDSPQTIYQTFAAHLYWDPGIHDIYKEAIQELGSTQFSLNHDRLLEIFFKDLLQATIEPTLKLAVELFRKRKSRSLVTIHMLRMLHDELNNSQKHHEHMQRLWEQQEDTNNSLHSMLHSLQLDEFGANTDIVKVPAYEFEESDNDETDDGGDAHDLTPESFNQVEKLIDYTMTGSPFQTFKSNLTCLTHPPTTIAEALIIGNSRALKRLLRKQFESIAQGEYVWLRELEELGHTKDEIAEILLEEARDSPWIFFTPAPKPDEMPIIQKDFHLHGCVHQLTWSSCDPTNDVESSTVAVDAGESVTLLEVQRLCGLAGITPSSRDIEEWNGVVAFEDDSTSVLITYGHSDIWKVTDRLMVTLELLCTALNRCQSQQLCCDSFTILKQPEANLNEQKGLRPVVEVCRIDFCIAFQMLDEVRSLIETHDTVLHDLPTATNLLLDIFQATNLAERSTEAAFTEAVHKCALSTQMMCLGFLSYLQAHVGPIHPFFLDTAIKRGKVFGCQMMKDIQLSVGIEMELVDLTCVGDMLQGPVLAFKLSEPSPAPRLLDSAKPLKYDLFTSSEDLIDTWGPAKFLLSNGNDPLPSAIRIGGGVIYPSDTTGLQFHWSRNATLTHHFRGDLDPTRKIRIGSPISVNYDCRLDEKLCRARSEAFGLLRYLGTHTPGWVRTEQQIGIQAGQYIMVQANAAYHKYPGRTLKQYRLEQGDQELMSFLEDCWAVQVSLCTGVARRVPLRHMVAELLPVFADNLTRCDDFANWEILRADSGMLEAFQGTKLKQWLRSLPKSHHDLILRMIRYILDVLSDTGLNRESGSFLVSWPYGSDAYQCLEINLSQQESSWAQIIADSEDCATFAYASPQCLETAEFPCRGADFCCWRNAVPLLETSVTICVSHESVTPLAATNKLVHQGIYYFKTFDCVHVVKAEQPDPTAVTKLVRKPSSLTDKMMHRLYTRTQLAKRLRERSTVQEIGGNVAWLTSSK